MKKINIIIVLMVASLSIGCNTQDLDPALEQNKDPRESITKVDNLYALMKGAYSRMTGSGYYGRDLIVSNEVRTDNVFSNGNSGRFITEALFNYSPTNTYFWDDAYRVISSANLVINTDLTQLEGDQDFGKHLQGQAYAMRALAHFDLLKQFGQQHVTGGTTPGGVPYVTVYRTSDSSQEELFPPRNTVEEVKTKIYEDLTQAYNLMEDSGEKNFFSKYAAKALESRVATYFEDWPKVIAASEDVINNTALGVVASADFVSSFASDGGKNIIFELEFSEADNLGSNSLAYIYRGSSYGDVQVVDDVLNLFEASDVRGLGSILGYEGSMLRNLGKYPNNQGQDNVAILRFEELILNYAEALFETSGDALTQLNKIPAQRGATLYTVASKENILLERRKELMFEGFYYDDLLRTGSDIEKTSTQQNILTTIPYGDHRLAWPIPRSEMDANSDMIQNKGY